MPVTQSAYSKLVTTFGDDRGDSVGGNVHNSDYAKSVSNSEVLFCGRIFVLRIICAKNLLKRGTCSSGKCLNASAIRII